MKLKFTLLLLIVTLRFSASAQSIQGMVSDKAGPLVGVSIFLASDSKIGTSSKADGSFELKAASPAILKVSYVGYETQTVTVNDKNAKNVRIVLEESAATLNEVVVGASKLEEKILEAPVSIYKLDAKSLEQTSATGPYDALQFLKGIRANMTSISFPSFATRGFSDANNLRMKSQIDGVDMNNTSGIPIGNSLGTSELDIVSIEAIPGPASALYGADAFSGMIRMYTKNPFDYTGLSASLKTGFSTSSGSGTNPYNIVAARYAAKLSDKIAFKIDAEYLKATDWLATGDERRVHVGEFDNRAAIMAGDVNAPDRELLHRFGVVGPMVFGPTELINPSGVKQTVILKRSGIAESDLWDNSLENYRVFGAVHIRPIKNWEIVLSGKYSKTDWPMRSEGTFPQKDYGQNNINLQIKNDRFAFSAYRTGVHNNNAIAANTAGVSLQFGLRSNEAWLADYKAEYAKSGSFATARQFASRFEPGGSQFNQAAYDVLFKEVVSGSNLGARGGFRDNSSFSHADISYDFSGLTNIVDVRVAASYRSFHVDSDGTFYNDAGFGGPFNVTQYGGVVDLTKKIGNLKLNGSLRYDKNSNYNAVATPKITGVYSFGKDKTHFLRASYQTGFRNPSLQEGFFRLEVAPNVYLAGTATSNQPNFILKDGGGTATKTMLDLLKEQNIKGVVPEKNDMFEVGYKTIIQNKFLIDGNYYRSKYENFGFRPVAVWVWPSGKGVSVLLPYSNLTDVVIAQGYGLSLGYLAKNYKLGLDYSHDTFDIPNYSGKPETKAAYMRNLSFNTPTDKVQLSLMNPKFAMNGRLGFALNFSYSTAFVYTNPYGEALFPAYNRTDLALTYKVPKIKSSIKLGANNLFNQEYQTVYGGANVGSIYYIGFRYN